MFIIEFFCLYVTYSFPLLEFVFRNEVICAYGAKEVGEENDMAVNIVLGILIEICISQVVEGDTGITFNGFHRKFMDDIFFVFEKICFFFETEHF